MVAVIRPEKSVHQRKVATPRPSELSPLADLRFRRVGHAGARLLLRPVQDPRDERLGRRPPLLRKRHRAVTQEKGKEHHLV